MSANPNKVFAATQDPWPPVKDFDHAYPPLISALSGTPNPNFSRPVIIQRLSESSKGADSTYSSSLQNARFSVERISDKKTTQLVSKPSELWAELNQARTDLKNANEKLVLLEKEKESALKQAKKYRKSSEEANEKLKAALAAKRRAERNAQAAIEQASIQGIKRREKKWLQKLEEVKNKHAVDLAALSSANQELEKTRQELTMTCNAKNQALIHADVAARLAEVHEKKVKDLTAELARLKDVFDAMMKMEATENEKLASGLKLKVDCLTQELEKAKVIEAKLAGTEDVLAKVTVSLKKSENENIRMAVQTTSLVNLLKATIKEAATSSQEVIRLKEALGETKAKSARLYEDLMKKENELKRNVSENEELMRNEVASLVNVEMLSNLLEEAQAKIKRVEEVDQNDLELNGFENEYDVLPKTTDFVNVDEKNVEDDDCFYEEFDRAKVAEGEGKEEDDDDDEDFSEFDIKMWENCEIDEKDTNTENVDNNSLSSKLDLQKKRKQALLGKIGSLLKK